MALLLPRKQKYQIFMRNLDCPYISHTYLRYLKGLCEVLNQILGKIVKERLKKTKQESLREKCSNTEFLLVRIFTYSDWIRKNTLYLSVFSPNTRKCGPEKTPYLDTFHAVNYISNWGKIRNINHLMDWVTQLHHKPMLTKEPSGYETYIERKYDFSLTSWTLTNVLCFAA